MNQLLPLLVMFFAAFGLGAFVATVSAALGEGPAIFVGLALAVLILLVIWDGPP